MKIFMKILVCVTVISMLLSLVSFDSTCKKLEQDVLRLHIRANSNTFDDQKLKLNVRDDVINNISPLYNGIKSKNEAKAVTQENLELIEQIAKETIKESGYTYLVNAQMKKEFFDTRYYENFTMPAGVYDTLLITIGEGKGDNWWCVMFPTLCVGACSQNSASDSLSDDEYDVITSDKYHFRFKAFEYFKKIYLYFC